MPYPDLFPGHARMTRGKAGDPSISLQWKGTKVCMDINCICGTQSHIDDWFCYNVECPGCGRMFALCEEIEAVELTPEETAYIKEKGYAYRTGEA